MSLPKPNTEQLLMWGPKVASGLMVVGIAYALTQLVWLFTGSAAPVVEPISSVTQTQSSTSTDANQLAQQISEYHLFGKSEVIPVDPSISAPETKLNLKLVGILSTGGKEGLALIASGGSKENVFKVGAKVPGNATLKAVYADKVLLESSRGLETLKLPKESGLIKFNEPKTSARYGGPGSKNAKSMANYRNAIANNPDALAQLAKALSPAKSETGELIGYKIAPNFSDPLYTGLGLQPNDVITSVNGVTLDRPENTMRAMQRLRRDKNLQVTILRDGNEMTLEHDIGR